MYDNTILSQETLNDAVSLKSAQEAAKAEKPPTYLIPGLHAHNVGDLSNFPTEFKDMFAEWDHHMAQTSDGYVIITDRATKEEKIIHLWESPRMAALLMGMATKILQNKMPINSESFDQTLSDMVYNAVMRIRNLLTLPHKVKKISAQLICKVLRNKQNINMTKLSGYARGTVGYYIRKQAAKSAAFDHYLRTETTETLAFAISGGYAEEPYKLGLHLACYNPQIVSYVARRLQEPSFEDIYSRIYDELLFYFSGYGRTVPLQDQNEDGKEFTREGNQDTSPTMGYVPKPSDVLHVWMACDKENKGENRHEDRRARKNAFSSKMAKARSMWFGPNPSDREARARCDAIDHYKSVQRMAQAADNLHKSLSRKSRIPSETKDRILDAVRAQRENGEFVTNKNGDMIANTEKLATDLGMAQRTLELTRGALLVELYQEYTLDYFESKDPGLAAKKHTARVLGVALYQVSNAINQAKKKAALATN